jgi:hypothetical protein
MESPAPDTPTYNRKDVPADRTSWLANFGHSAQPCGHWAFHQCLSRFCPELARFRAGALPNCLKAAEQILIGHVRSPCRSISEHGKEHPMHPVGPKADRQG